MFESVNPYTGELLGSEPALTDRQLSKRLVLAQSAFLGFWKLLPIEDRVWRVSRMADSLLANREDLARELTLEMGKPISQARAEIDKCAWLCRHAASVAAEQLAPRTVHDENLRASVNHRPLGGLLGIMPWNFPYWQSLRFAIPAMLAGNVVLVKPAPNVTRSAMRLSRLLEEAIGEPGVFQTLLIDHSQIESVIAHPFIAGVSLTGSERAGSAVAALAGKHLKKCLLELGGSDAFIVFEDADLEEATQAALTSRMGNNGQTCIAAKRLIVQQSVLSRFTDAFLSPVSSLQCEDPLSDHARLSCLARPDLSDALTRQVSATLALGARPLLSGGLMPGSETRFMPWVLTDIPPASPAATEELFGPVASIFAVPDAEAAITLANATRFGLGTSIWTSDLDRAVTIASQIEAGTIAINQMVASDPRLPFGGVKHSGFGRELGPEGFLEFSNIQSITLPSPT